MRSSPGFSPRDERISRSHVLDNVTLLSARALTQHKQLLSLNVLGFFLSRLSQEIISSNNKLSLPVQHPFFSKTGRNNLWPFPFWKWWQPSYSLLEHNEICVIFSIFHFYFTGILLYTAAWCFSCSSHSHFRLQVVFACIYTFPVDIMLTKFATQLINWCIVVVRKHSIYVFGVSGEFHAPKTLLVSCAAIRTCLNCLGRGRSVRNVLPRQKCPPFSQNRNFSQIGPFRDIPCFTIGFIFPSSVRQWLGPTSHVTSFLCLSTLF